MYFFTLTDSQRNEVIAALNRHGAVYVDAEFEWTAKGITAEHTDTGPGYISILTHVPTSCYFSFYMVPGFRKYDFAPGSETETESGACKNWAEMMVGVERWAGVLADRIGKPVG